MTIYVRDNSCVNIVYTYVCMYTCLIQVTWKYEDGELPSRLREGYRPTTTGAEVEIKWIYPLESSESGIYSCQATNDVGTDVKSFTLIAECKLYFAMLTYHLITVGNFFSYLQT